jgi:hypothetical protein
MATLTGQQINNTYDGLLKLADSTTGITTSLQAIEDGLGNDTGSKIATNLFTAPNVVQMNINGKPPQYLGVGANTTGTVSPGNVGNNNLIFQYFYDPGVYSYSAMTHYVSTITSTSDVVEVFIYEPQFVNDYGWFPNNLLFSGISLTTSATGFHTTTFATPLSFTGTGGGLYCYVLKYTNATGLAYTPTVRFGTPQFAIYNQSFAYSLGFVRNNLGNAFLIGNRAATYQGNTSYWFTNQTTPATITASDVATRFNTTTTQNIMGFQFHTIK